MGIEHFRDVMKCDLCSYTATGNKVGRQVASNHITQIKERLYALVEWDGELRADTRRLPPKKDPLLGSSISTDVNSYILSEEAWHVAAESLIDAHKDEFVRMFQKAYMDVLAKNSTDDVVLARAAAMASTYYDVGWRG